MIVSCEASYNFHRTSFQNERFARGFLKISQKKLPKLSFRARLPPNFREKASKRIVSCEASSKFHRTILPKRAFRATLPTISAENLRFATVSRDRHTDSCERVHPAQMCVALQRRAFPNVTMCVSLQRRAQKCMNLSTMNRPASHKQKCKVLLQFWAIDATFLARGFTASNWNLCFATVLGDRHHVFGERVHRD